MRIGLVTIGIALVACGFCLSFAHHSQVWYTPFVVGGFLLLEGVNGSNRFSILKHTEYFLKLWLVFLGLTIAIEAIGAWWLNLWSYPHMAGFEYVFHALIIGVSFHRFPRFGIVCLASKPVID